MSSMGLIEVNNNRTMDLSKRIKSRFVPSLTARVIDTNLEDVFRTSTWIIPDIDSDGKATLNREVFEAV